MFIPLFYFGFPEANLTVNMGFEKQHGNMPIILTVQDFSTDYASECSIAVLCYNLIISSHKANDILEELHMREQMLPGMDILVCLRCDSYGVR